MIADEVLPELDGKHFYKASVLCGEKTFEKISTLIKDKISSLEINSPETTLEEPAVEEKDADALKEDADALKEDAITNEETAVTINPLYKNAIVYSEGNLGATIAASAFESGITTFGASTAKWYCEFKITAQASGVTRNGAGIIADTEADGMADAELGYSPNSVAYSSGAVHKDDASQSAGSWNTYTTNDIISVAMDLDNGFVYFAKNGTWENSGDPTSAGSGTGGIALDITSGYTYLFGNVVYAGSAFQCNFGNPPYSLSSAVSDANDYGNFEYEPPSGYLALCTKNLGSDGG